MEKSSIDYFNDYDVLEKKSKEDLDNLYQVEQQILEIQKQIIALQGKKKDLEIIRNKASYIVRQQQIDLRQLKSLGFKARNSGL